MRKSTFAALVLIISLFILCCFFKEGNSQTPPRDYSKHPQCKSLTVKKERCKNYVLKNDSLCYFHRKIQNEKNK